MEIKTQNDHMGFRCSLPIKSTLGKRRVGHVGHDAHESELSVTLSRQGLEIMGIFWIRDNENRQFAFSMKEDELLVLAKQIDTWKKQVMIGSIPLQPE